MRAQRNALGPSQAGRGREAKIDWDRRSRRNARHGDDQARAAAADSEICPHPLQVSPAIHFAAVSGSISRHVGEEADTYPGLVVRLNDDWRIIAGRCGLQWVVQHRSPNGKWSGRRYHRQRDPMLNLSVRELCGPVDAGALAALRDLAEWFPCSGGNR
jgi:hypothetical protein